MNRYRKAASCLLFAIFLLTIGSYGLCQLGGADTGCGVFAVIGGASFGVVLWIVVLVGFVCSFRKKREESERY